MNIPKKCQTTPESEKFYKKSQEAFIKEHPLPLPLSYNIISLGYDCSVRSILTDWGLKPTKAMGELSYPFDLSFSPHQGVLGVLQNGFKDFFDNLSFNHETHLWENKQYGFYYNHDMDCTENDREKFVIRFKNRIQNFYKILDSDIPIIFVAYIQKGKTKNIKIIYKIFRLLKEKRKNKKSYLVVLSEKAQFLFPKNTYILRIHVPFSKYIWWKPEMRYSYDGAKFESEIAHKFYKVVQKILKKEVK